MKLLVVEDDAQIRAFLVKGFLQEGFAVDETENGIEAETFLSQRAYAAAILDCMLPGKGGLEVIAAVRAAGCNTPILCLSAREGVDDRIRGLNQGADDYVVKPFVFAEVLARIHSLVRRAQPAAVPVTKLACADLTMDLLTREVRRGTTAIALQPREFALLELLLRNAGQVVSRANLLENVWGFHFDPQTNVVDVLVSRVRSKIDRDHPRLIHTLRGGGYAIKPE